MIKQRREPLKDAHVVAALDPDRWVTRQEIANALSLKVHPALIHKIESLVTEDIIQRHEEDLGRGKSRMWYWTTPQTIIQAQEALNLNQGVQSDTQSA